MKSRFLNYSYYFLSGFVMHIVITEEMFLLQYIFLASFALCVASEIRLYYLENKLKNLNLKL